MGETNKKDILLIIVGICAFILAIAVFVDFIRVNNKVSEIREQMNEVCEKYLSCPDNIQETYKEQIKEIKLGKSFFRLLVQMVFYVGIGLLCFSYVGSDATLSEMKTKIRKNEKKINKITEISEKTETEKGGDPKVQVKKNNNTKSGKSICEECGRELLYSGQPVCPWCGAKVK